MEMQQVRYFLAVAKTLNFTRAAEQCNVTQPALTRAIKQLEDELGGELIRREGRLSHLTDLGMRMLPLLTQCFESANTAKSLATKLRKGEVAALAIGVSVTFETDLLIEPLAEMHRGFPGLQLKLRRGSGAQLAEWLKSGDIDLAFGGPLGENWDRLDTWPLFTEAFDLVVAPDHALAARDTIEPEDDAMRGERLLMHSFVDEAELPTGGLEAIGISLDHSHEVNCNRDLEALLNARIGVAILPQTTFRSARLRHIRFPSLDLTRTVAAYGIAGRARSREANALLGLVRMTDWTDLLEAA